MRKFQTYQQILFCCFTLLIFSCKNSTQWKPELLKQFEKNGIESKLPDYSYAGYAYGEIPIPTNREINYTILDYGAIPNDGIDDTEAINKTIEIAGKNGGGTVLFPKGIFHVNMDSTKTDIIKINYSNLILRGAGSGENGTVIYSGTPTNQTEDNSPWLSPFVFHSGLNLHGTSSFFTVDDLDTLTSITATVLKGSSTIKVESTTGLQAGEIIIIALQNTSKEGNLIHDLMQPLEFEPFQKSYTEAGIQKAKSFQWPVEIAAIIDTNHILLKQPTRRNLLIKYQPTISRMPMLHNIGIEHFKFESAWDGNYKHHGNREMDYGWGAINLHRVSHGWIRDIHINNYTQTTHLVNSRNVTIENIRITGKKGHYSPKMYHSSDNLVQNILVESKMTHGPGLEGCSFGNVYKDMTFKFPTTIDLHGIANPGFCPPMYNLFENINNIEKIAGGGAPQNLPHSGEYNTFWDIEIEGWKDKNYQEVFYSWIWRDPKRFKNKLHVDCHKQYLRSNVIGLHSSNPKTQLSIEHSTEDRANEWIYVEGLNRQIEPVSLYQTQLNLRLH